jgi:hypothetical protein
MKRRPGSPGRRFAFAPSVVTINSIAGPSGRRAEFAETRGVRGNFHCFGSSLRKGNLLGLFPRIPRSSADSA